jgi:predicted  nucleic acid-binding Zn-ribbon protein
MDKTRVDDMLIDMISPKIKEIEEKFSSGKGLDQGDINTLLLKSQYNHINHLDDKLNEVTADVASLKGEFNGLKGEFNGLKGEFNSLKGEFNTKFAQLETKFEQAQVKMQDTIISTMRWYIGGAGIVLVIIKALDIFIK